MGDSTIAAADVEDLARGCALLGSGGGGDPHTLAVALRAGLEERGPLVLRPARALAADAQVVNVGFVGAPITMTEKLLCESEILGAVQAMQDKLGRRIDALMPAEIGGGNGITALLAASLCRLPVVDADGMGRAFPMSDQTTYSIYGLSASPTVVTTEHGEIVCIEGTSNRRIEQLVRVFATAGGHKCFSVDYPLRGSDVVEFAVPGTVSLARAIGRSLRRQGDTHADALQGLQAGLAAIGGPRCRVLFEGKIVDCTHETRGGFGFGVVAIDSVPTGSRMHIRFQNEFLVAECDGVPVATTPDIIAVTDSETLLNIGSESVRYGQRVKVLALEAPSVLTTEAALRFVGPRAFGFDLDYRPVAGLR